MSAHISPLCAGPSPTYFLLGNYIILVFPLLSPARTVFRGRRQVYLQLVFVIFMFPCLFQTFMCFIVVQDDILMHPAFHVGLGSTCRHISTFPSASGSCDMLSSRCFFSAIFITFRFIAPTRKDASTVLPECLFPFVLWIGLAPDNPAFLLV